MFKIGEFSKLAGVTVKTLRHYDQLGLLKPIHIDEESKYRYYTAEQLLTVRRIASFKEQGLTLEQMRPLMADSAALTDAESMLKEKREELKRLIQAMERQVVEIDERLVQLDRISETTELVKEEEEGFALHRVEPILAASIREQVPKDHLCLLLDELKQYVRGHGEQADHKVMIIWHRRADGSSSLSDIEVAIPISKPIPYGRRVKVGILPGLETAASLKHLCDPYLDDCRAEEELQGWIKAEGYRRLEAEPTREVFLTSDKDIYGRLRLTEAIVPVEPLPSDV
ncbi:MerR family transcriptional regulator [Paenibacillus sp. OAS669]|uniref:MerR family transcriptional regulator n=1 Tax=Paenibacillus sp. OAS669 TaxID=2663821 RepID=UPI00178A6299|nr:helix-turn-helix domain-containing protein [Paenibacillus sp. OAS669]MBE1442790.1 DNA-binding transcriptional MerR regulator [Paenibacillus sp. OAS669]